MQYSAGALLPLPDVSLQEREEHAAKQDLRVGNKKPRADNDKLQR
jgi:hypothetical protein